MVITHLAGTPLQRPNLKRFRPHAPVLATLLPFVMVGLTVGAVFFTLPRCQDQFVNAGSLIVPEGTPECGDSNAKCVGLLKRRIKICMLPGSDRRLTR